MTTPRIEEKSFEKYLEQICFEANPQVLDDDMPDFFDDWLGSQDGEDYIRLADEYAKSLITAAHQAGIDEAVEKLQKEFDKHNVYPMTWEQESKTFVDGVWHAIKALQDNK